MQYPPKQHVISVGQRVPAHAGVGIGVGDGVGDGVVGAGVGDGVVGAGVGDDVVGDGVGERFVGDGVGDEVVGDGVGDEVVGSGVGGHTGTFWLPRPPVLCSSHTALDFICSHICSVHDKCGFGFTHFLLLSPRSRVTTAHCARLRSRSTALHLTAYQPATGTCLLLAPKLHSQSL